MKTVFFIRHAKSSWSDIGIKDIDRPLNDRGERDALKMGQYLNSLEEKIDLFISSPANRAHTTALNIAKGLRYDKSIQLEKSLYEFSNYHIYFELLSLIENSINSVAIFGHNEAMADLANTISKGKIYDFTTCNVLKVHFNMNDWKEITILKTKIAYHLIPKNIL